MKRYETAAFKDCGVRKTQLDVLVELSDLYPSLNFRISGITFLEPDMVVTTITLMERKNEENRDGTGEPGSG